MINKLKNIKERNKLAEEFQSNNGGIYFDFKNKTLIFPDGGLFSMEKKVETVSNSKFVLIKEGDYKDCLKLVPTKGTKKVDNLSASMWFEDVKDTIRYFRRLDDCLKKMGYNTDMKYPPELIQKLKRIRVSGLKNRKGDKK